MHNKKLTIIIAIFLVALIARIIFAFLILPVIETKMALRFDGDRYGTIAESIREGHYTDIIRGPVYPFFIAAIYQLFGTGLTPVRLAQAVLDSTTAVLLFAVAFLAGFSFRTALLASLLYAFYPLALWRVCFVNKESAFTLLSTIVIMGMLAALKRTKAFLHYGMVGILLGIANLCKPMLVFFPLVILCYLIGKTADWKKSIAYTIALVIGMAIVTIPWTMRNYCLTGEFLPVATETGGRAVFIGNHYPSRGSYEGPLKPLWRAAVREVANNNPGLSDIELDRLYYKKALERIVHHPLGTVEMWFRKFFRFWFIPASERLLWLTIPLQAFLLITALLGIVLPKEPSVNSTPLLVFILYVMAVHILSYACIRFSLPVMPCVCIFSAYFLSLRIFSKFRIAYKS